MSIEWEKFTDEASFKNTLMEFLKEGLKPFLQKYNLKIGKDINLLKDVNIVPREDDFELLMGFSQADLVIYKECLSLAKAIKNERPVRLYGKGQAPFIYPFILLELKNARSLKSGVSSHELNTYTRKAGEFKERYSYLKAFLVFCRQIKEERTLCRQVRNFDAIYAFRVKKDNCWQPLDSEDTLLAEIKLNIEKLHSKGVI